MDDLPIVSISTAAGTYSTRAAVVVGPFAIHRTWGMAGWTLTHMASGRALAQCLHHKESAEALAEALPRVADWDFTDASTVWAWSRGRQSKVRGLIRAFKRDDELGRFKPSDRMTTEPEGRG